MENIKTTPTQPNHEQIAQFAYLLWEQAGRPSGRDREHWQQAELHLKSLVTQQEAQRTVAPTQPPPVPVQTPPAVVAAQPVQKAVVSKPLFKVPARKRKQAA